MTLAAIWQDDKGDCYQIALTKQHQLMISHLIMSLHDGAIKIIEPKLCLKLETNTTQNTDL